MPGQRKSIGPMAERLGVDSQKLQQFITDSPWEESAIWKAIRPLAADCLEPLEAWIVDETGWLKQGEHSVGVAHQYCGAAGKSANCQVNVQVAITDGRVAVPVGAQLYLPERWTKDRARCREAGVPDEVGFATKRRCWEITLTASMESFGTGFALWGWSSFSRSIRVNSTAGLNRWWWRRSAPGGAWRPTPPPP
jgi:SRSO17 transposase